MEELEETVALQKSRQRALQRDGGGAQAPPRPATPAEQREFIEDGIRFLEASREHFTLARVDQATLDRVLAGWHAIVSHAEGVLTTPADDALRTRLRTAYIGALRVLVTRASVQLRQPAIRLYLDNVRLIPAWAWPGTDAFELQNQEQRRAFVQATTDALNAINFSGFQQFTDAILEDLLTRLRTLVDEEHAMIATHLGNDVALRDALRGSYRRALDDLLSRAAASTNTSRELLYLHWRYRRNLIPDWADVQVAGITTPLPIGSSPDPISGEVRMTISGVNVVFLPDGTRAGTSAETSINWNFNNAIQAQTQGGRVVSHVGPGVPEARIRTRYPANLTAADPSGYGRGTTQADIAAGDTTLGFHEGSHGRDFLRFLVTHPFPTFTGQDGMTTQQFQQAMQQYTAACQQYSTDINRDTELNTDCVGITIEDYYNARNQQSPVNCP